MNRTTLSFLLSALLLAACGDPEQSAQKALAELGADWGKAQQTLDPARRLKEDQAVIQDLDSLIDKYKDTQAGQALAAGRPVGSVSPVSLRGEVERLAPRAACYAAPDAKCLLPFASSGFQREMGGAGNDATQQAMQLVCSEGFASAESALADMKINRPVYASTLLQLALQAAQCNKPDELRAAVAAYMVAEPAQGASRISQLMSVLQTDALQPAWGAVLDTVEKEAPQAGLSPATEAGMDLTLAIRYADMGNADQALAKFRHVTDELGFSTDINSRRELASALIANGHAEAGMELAGRESVKNIPLIALHGAVATLGGRLGVIRPAGASTANVPYNGDLTEFFAPVDSETRKTDGEIAAQIEAELDKFVAPLQPTGDWLGMSGAETIYGMLALVQQKLGNAEHASALVKKAEETRVKLSRPGAYQLENQSYLAEFQLLVALGQGDIDQAAALLGRVVPVGNDDANLVLVALARKGDAEQALTLAAQVNRASANTYQMLINEMGEHGHADKAEAVLNAFPGSADTRAGLAWGLVEKAAAGGDLASAERVAEKYQLLNNPAYRLRMATMKAEASIAAKKRGDAEAAIRDVFAQGDALDKAGSQYGTRQNYAQNAVALAFRAGYVDLGIELYRAASVKDQRPFFAAFEGNAQPQEFPKVLMVAHDNLRGEELGYVIDAAIRWFNQHK